MAKVKDKDEANYKTANYKVVRNLPAKQEMRVWSLNRDDPLEKEMATYSGILAWRIPWTEDPDGYSPRGHKELDAIEQLNHNNNELISLKKVINYPYWCSDCSISGQ